MAAPADEIYAWFAVRVRKQNKAVDKYITTMPASLSYDGYPAGITVSLTHRCSSTTTNYTQHTNSTFPTVSHVTCGENTNIS
jgi:hypothetical protein